MRGLDISGLAQWIGDQDRELLARMNLLSRHKRQLCNLTRLRETQRNDPARRHVNAEGG